MISNDLKKDLLLTNGACALVRRRVSDPRAGEVGAVTDVWPSRQARGGYRLTLAFSKDTLKRNYDAGDLVGTRPSLAKIALSNHLARNGNPHNIFDTPTPPS